MSIAAHKLRGPKGAGALVLDKRLDLRPLIAGGGHERGLRSGTENVAAIVGFGRACELINADLVQDSAAMLKLREQIEQGLAAQGAVIFAQTARRLPNTVYFALPGIDGETLVGKLDRAGFAVASGSACSSAQPEPSHVLRAMSVEDELARGAVRISMGRENTAEQVTEFLRVLGETAFKLRRLTALAG
jgi:cysteine desulfurase